MDYRVNVSKLFCILAWITYHFQTKLLFQALVNKKFKFFKTRYQLFSHCFAKYNLGLRGTQYIRSRTHIFQTNVQGKWTAYNYSRSRRSTHSSLLIFFPLPFILWFISMVSCQQNHCRKLWVFTAFNDKP